MSNDREITLQVATFRYCNFYASEINEQVVKSDEWKSDFEYIWI